MTPLTWHRAAILEGRTGRQMRPSPMPPSSAASDLMFHHARRMDDARDSSQRKEGYCTDVPFVKDSGTCMQEPKIANKNLDVLKPVLPTPWMRKQQAENARRTSFLRIPTRLPNTHLDLAFLKKRKITEQTCHKYWASVWTNRRRFLSSDRF